MKIGMPFSDTHALLREALPNKTLRRVTVLAFWTVVATLSAAHWQLFYHLRNPYTWWELFRIKLVLWLVWGVLTPYILALGHRFRIERQLIPERIAALVIASVLITFGYLLVYTWLVLVNLGHHPAAEGGYPGMLRFVISFHSTYYFLAFWASIGIEHAIGYYRQSRERRMQALRLETQLAQVQLAALRNQLQPHFLFNTLHSIAALVRRADNQTAIKMLTGLSDLLRHTLDHLDRHEVPLREEVGYLNRYVAIEQVRFSDRLVMRDRIDPATLSAFVPSFVLQPLVENAIRHGLDRQSGRGVVEIRSERRDDALLIEVHDNGPGVDESASRPGGSGIGLGATRARLDALYRNDYSFEVLRAEGGGTTARLTIPFHTQPIPGVAPSGESDHDPRTDR